MNNERDALKRAFIALYHMLIEWDISPSVAIDPPKRYPLTDEAIHQLFKHLPSENRDGWVVAFARAIERAHEITE